MVISHYISSLLEGHEDDGRGKEGYKGKSEAVEVNGDCGVEEGFRNVRGWAVDWWEGQGVFASGVVCLFPKAGEVADPCCQTWILGCKLYI